jgi:hypothetical protein
MVSFTAMEYTGGQVDLYITENTKRINRTVKDTIGGQMEKNIAENTRMTCYMDRESNKKTENYTALIVMKAS